MTLVKRRISAFIATVSIAVIAVSLLSGCSVIQGFIEPENEDSPTFTVTDKAENEKEPSIDKNVVMSVLGDRDTYVLRGEEYIESGCQAVSKKSGVINAPISVEGTVDTSKPGNYEIKYMVATKGGKVATAKRNVHVVTGFDEEAKNIPVLMYHYVYSS